MRRMLIALLVALPLPAAAQDEGSGPMERGLRLFMDGLRDEMEPALRDLEGLTRDAAPLLRRLQESLGSVVGDLDAYEAPEFLPNGDILIRRRSPLPPADEPEVPVEPNADGTLDL